MGIATETLELYFLDGGLVHCRRGVAGEQNGLAIVAGTAVEPIDGDAFRGRLEQQAVIVGFALPRLRAQLHLRAVARDSDDLLECEVTAGECDGLAAQSVVAGIVGLSGEARERR